MITLKNIGVYECQCERCGYVWISKISSPIKCANKKCNSPYWNRKRIERRNKND